jgi:hypothetical protein
VHDKRTQDALNEADDMRDNTEHGDDERDEYPPCPVCGDPIDYCMGHPDVPIESEL